MKKVLFGFLLFSIILGMFTIEHPKAETNEVQKENETNNESKRYVVLFKDELIENIGKEKEKKLDEKKPKWKNLFNSNGIEILKEYKYFPIMVVKMSQEKAEVLSKNPLIEAITEDKEIDYAPAYVSDSLYNIDNIAFTNYALYETDRNYLSDIKADALWNQGYTGRGIKVATFEHGFRTTHNELSYAFEGGVNCLDGCKPLDGTFDSHGTRVAGLIAGSHDYKTTDFDVKGVSPNVFIYSVVAADESAFTTHQSRIIDSLQWAIDNQMDIINFSYQIDVNNNSVDAKLTEAYLGNTFHEQGILLVASGGNYYQGSKSEESMAYPANYGDAIGVSFSKRVGNGTNSYEIVHEKDEFGNDMGSSVGKDMELTAPGYYLVSSDSTSDSSYDYRRGIGSSFSAPLVTGIAANLIQKFPEASAKEIRFLLQEYAYLNRNKEWGYNLPTGYDATSGDNRDHEYGYGMVQGDVGVSTFKRLVFSSGPKEVKMSPTGMRTHRTITTLQPDSRKGYTIIRKYEKSYEKWYQIEFKLNSKIRHGWVKATDDEIKDFTITIQNATSLYDHYNDTKNYLGPLSPGTYTLLYTYGSWLYVVGDGKSGWISPGSHYENEFYVVLNTDTMLYSSYGGSYTGAVISASSTNKATVTADTLKLGSDGTTRWFRVYTSYGWRWIKPPTGTYGLSEKYD